MNTSLNISLSSAVLLAVAFWLTLVKDVSTFQPDFAEPIINISVAIGRDATFTCHVRHLGGYRVGWVKANTKAIQAIHEQVITHNPRVTVSHADLNTWNLHIKSVMEEDRGGYMCQLNTDPMKSQIGYLDVVIPPDFITEDTSSDVIVPEGSSVKLTCRAKGYPEPVVTWRREDGTEIVLKDSAGTKQLVTSYRGEVLKLVKISRSEMGSYLCIASNGVPPSVSKRISLSIHFHPVIQVPNQLVGAPLGTDVSIECLVEASPKSINYWVKDTEMIVSSPKYQVQDIPKSLYETKMTMTVRAIQKEDMGSYRCIAKNSLGEVDSSIRLYEIPQPNRKVYSPKYGTDQNDIVKPGGNGDKSSKPKLTYPTDDEEQQYGGSAEDFEDMIDSMQPHQHHHHHSHQQQHPYGSRPTSRSPFGSMDHPNSINGRNGNGNGGGTSSNSNNKNLIPLMNDIATRKPFVIPPGRAGDGSLEGSNAAGQRITTELLGLWRSVLVLLGTSWYAIHRQRH
ncbi:lachesin isoform X2 [Aedes aegypti]|uniref:Ig-like domain-containing protein n=1 Tax=Aedes aegypti TaxID=7159 RepID=A0A6I8TA57_AEDAE|nr:lachesin isoform X2 [Aedes aegypti]